MKPKTLFAGFLASLALSLLGLAGGGAAQAQSKSVSQDFSPVEMSATSTKSAGGKKTPSVTPHKAPPLMLQWWVLKLDEQGGRHEIDPSLPLAAGDRVQLGVKTNQEGYLYVIRNEEGQDGQLVFPDTRARNGQNRVKVNEEYVVPGECERCNNKVNCGWTMPRLAAVDKLTIIFSRQMLTDLNNHLTADGGIRRDYVARLQSQAQKEVPFTRQKGLLASQYVARVAADDQRDSAKVVATFRLSHKGQDDESAGDGIRSRGMIKIDELPESKPVHVSQAVKEKIASGLSYEIIKYDAREARFKTVSPNTKFQKGDQVRVRFRSNFKGYIYFVNISPGGETVALFGEQVPAEGEYEMPGKGAMGFDDEVGTEVLKIFMSRQPIPLFEAALKKPGSKLSVGQELGLNGQPAPAKAVPAAPQPKVCAVERVGFSSAESLGLKGWTTREVILAPGQSNEDKNTIYAVTTQKAGQGGQAEAVGYQLKDKELSTLEIYLEHTKAEKLGSRRPARSKFANQPRPRGVSHANQIRVAGIAAVHSAVTSRGVAAAGHPAAERRADPIPSGL